MHVVYKIMAYLLIRSGYCIYKITTNNNATATPSLLPAMLDLKPVAFPVKVSAIDSEISELMILGT